MSNTGTQDTMPCHHWVAAALDEAHVSVEDMERYVTRGRMHLWFDSGETVSGAADMLKRFIEGGKHHDRVDGEVEFLRKSVKLGLARRAR